MMGGAMRILQVGELRLDKPLEGDFSAFPNGIQAQIFNAKFLAAEKLFAAAITEQVDLVLLAGNPTQSSGGTRPYWFLQREFVQLSKHGIKVVIVEATDKFYWPEEIQLPENVNVLTRSQSIGFRIAADQPPIEFEWEASESSDAYDSRIGINLRLREVGGRVTSVSYSAHENQSAETVQVHLSQPESIQESGSFAGTLVEMSPTSGIEQTPVKSQVLHWEKTELTVSHDEGLASLKDQLVDHLESLKRSQSQNSIRSLLTISIQSQSTDSLDLTHDSLRSSLEELQKNAFTTHSSYLPIRIEIEHNSIKRSENIPSALRVALDELSSVQLEEVYENLDLHVLDFEAKSFETSKHFVAQRLPRLMNEACL